MIHAHVVQRVRRPSTQHHHQISVALVFGNADVVYGHVVNAIARTVESRAIVGGSYIG